MGASHFFVGLSAGVAILAVPILTLTPGMDLPHRFALWIDGPGSQSVGSSSAVDAVSRPRSGYTPGQPTPAVAAPPTLQPVAQPTAVVVQAAQASLAPIVQPPPGALHTGVIRAGGTPVYVRRAAGVESPGDPLITDGSPVLVSAGGVIQVAGQTWRAVRGLNGVAGWVPGAQVVVDGEAPPAPVVVSPAPTSGPAARGSNPTTGGGAAPTTSATPAAGGIVVSGAPLERLKVANTDGAGVVLRNSPRDADRSRNGLLDGALVYVVERSGTDWVHVRADNGLEGWLPTRYVAPAS
jgi:SH3-like domain-containing protein